MYKKFQGIITLVLCEQKTFQVHDNIKPRTLSTNLRYNDESSYHILV